MMVTIIPMDFTYAASSLLTKTYANSMTIGNSSKDRVAISVSKSDPYSFNIKCTHSQDFDQMDIRVYKHGTSTRPSSIASNPMYISTGLGAGETWEKTFSCRGLPVATYRLSIYKKDESAAEPYKPYVDRVAFYVTKSGVKLIDYSAIRSNNVKVRGWYDPLAYKEKDLNDLKYIIFEKAGTSTRRTINSSTEAAYYKKVASGIVSSSDSNYTKMKKFYKYTAEKLYYDNYKSKPYDDPYYNLRHINKLDSKSGYNWSSGKVAVQCDGYAALLVALGRSQGIPCRMVTGNLLSSDTETWNSQKYVNAQTHCWVQAYVGGKWIEIDPCRASFNKRNKNGSWTKVPQISYMFFDMRDSQMAQTHCSVTFYGGDRSPAYMSSSAEISKIKSFLNYGGNGKKLNKNYSASQKSTWSNESVFYTNGKGRIENISWKQKGLRGKLDVSGFTALRNVTVSGNSLTSLNLKGCTNLQYVYAGSNKLTTINTQNLKKLKEGYFRYNKLKSAYVYVNKKNRSVVVNQGKGTFSCTTGTSKITIYSSPASGYKLKGIYSSSGKKISSRTTCTIKPTYTKYYVKFVKK